MTIPELLKYAKLKTAYSETDEILEKVLPLFLKIGITPTKELVDILIDPIDDALENHGDYQMDSPRC